MALTKAERVARTIARLRTEVAKLSLKNFRKAIDNWTSGESLYYDDQIARIKLGQANAQKAMDDEVQRYKQLVANNVYSELCAIQGITDVTTRNGALFIHIKARVPYNDYIFHFGDWILEIPNIKTLNNFDTTDIEDDTECIADDGTWVIPHSEYSLPFCRLKGGFSLNEHPDYPGSDVDHQFCFGDSAGEIESYILSGDIVSAAILASLCLHSTNYDFADFEQLPYRLAYDTDISELADFFGINSADFAKYRANLQDRRGKYEDN